MKYILLCGGSGKRVSDNSLFPKPMNYVLGSQSIKYVIDSIPTDEIYIIVNKDLINYNFETSLYHITKKKCHFIYLDRYTRGAVETAYLGIKKMKFDSNEQICFFDNDTVYELTNFQFPNNNFVCYSSIDLNSNENKPYCFINMDNNNLTQITEKVKISNNYICGIYGFKTLQLFIDLAQELLMSNLTFNNEYYMSLLYDKMIKKNINVNCLEMPIGSCLGTPEDIAQNYLKIKKESKRICFDIDNTLFYLRSPTQTYKDIYPIPKILFLIQELKKEGHHIILYTARGMRSNKSNCGLAMKNVAKDTFDVLEKFKIPFDEIYFGKPDADIYIDDKAFNPYSDNLFDLIGFSHFNDTYKNKIIESSTNKFNTIIHKGSRIYKEGPIASMSGEVFFYKSIKDTPISNFFPKYYTHIQKDKSIILDLEFINGYLLFDLLRDELIAEYHIYSIIDSLKHIHSYKGLSITIDKHSIYDNYMGKLWKRIENKLDYPFDNTLYILEKIDKNIKQYLNSNEFNPVAVVNGDCWFSNILITNTNKLYFLDMKGSISDTLTTNGDPLTDFGKILQSLLGFDFIVNNIKKYNKEYLLKLRNMFISKIENIGYSKKNLIIITACLIAKTLSFLKVSDIIRLEIWQLVVDLLDEL